MKNAPYTFMQLGMITQPMGTTTILLLSEHDGEHSHLCFTLASSYSTALTT
jgi:hypothetical protein